MGNGADRDSSPGDGDGAGGDSSGIPPAGGKNQC